MDSQAYVSGVSQPTKLWGMGDVYYALNLTEQKEDNPVRQVQKKWREKQKKPYDAFCIYGECKCLDFIIDTLADSKCRSLHLLFGDKIWSDEQKKKLGELVEQYEGRFFVWRNKYRRPAEHAIMLADDIMIESDHDFEKTYELVECTERATRTYRNMFKKGFERLKRDSEKITLSNVESVPVYEKAAGKSNANEVAC